MLFKVPLSAIDFEYQYNGMIRPLVPPWIIWLKQIIPLNRSNIAVIACPIILANMATPMLGFVDTAVIGNLGDPALLGAIALGGMIFSFLYWGFGFLRMGTTGLVAQALGARNTIEIKGAFYRAILTGVAIGTALVVLQYPLSQAALYLIDGSPAVETAAKSYFAIRIWGAPISLANLAVMGYLLGVQKTRALLFLQMVLAGSNILLDVVFVVGFEWGVEGVAGATLIAEALTLLTGFFMIRQQWQRDTIAARLPLSVLLNTGALKRMITVNSDIMIRTLCLIFTFAWFTNEGAQAGDVMLASNAILMQFVTFAAFFLDGFALATETLIGQAVGDTNIKSMDIILRYSFEIGLATACLLSLLFYLLGPDVIRLLTSSADVRHTSGDYLLWAVFAPPIAFPCFLLDGAFIGATRTKEMRNAMIASLLAFMLAWWVLTPWGNDGLWLALHLYFIARALSLFVYLPKLRVLGCTTNTQ
ncbi:MAG: MATE family multidrug resistance protein [Candidatus Pseudothioglobus sp.]|jgi:MATE family multidrug resistance protein